MLAFRSVVALLIVLSFATAHADEATKIDDVPRPRRALCIGFAAGAATLLFTGIVLGGVAKGRESEQEGNPGAPSVYTTELEARGHAGESMATAAYVFLGIGAALAITDLALWVERLRKAPRKKEAVSLAPAVTIAPGPTGLQVTF